MFKVIFKLKTPYFDYIVHNVMTTNHILICQSHFVLKHCSLNVKWYKICQYIWYIQEKEAWTWKWIIFFCRNIGINSVGCAIEKVRMRRKGVNNAITCFTQTVCPTRPFVLTVMWSTFKQTPSTGSIQCFIPFQNIFAIVAYCSENFDHIKIIIHNWTIFQLTF